MKAYPEYKPSGIDWLDKIPSHWDSMPLKYTVKNQETDFIDGDWIESPFITETGVRYLTSGNVGPGFYKEQGNGFISNETFDKLNCIEVLPGDLLISRLNEPIARTCEVPELGYKIVTCVDNVIYRPISDIFSRRFMMYHLNSEPFWFNASGLSSGATMKRISRSKLGNIKVIVPPLKEQEVIAAYLDDVTGKVDALIAEKQKQVEDLRKYRTSLITETVTRGLNPTTPIRQTNSEWYPNIPYNWNVEKFKYQASVKANLVHPEDYTKHPQISPDSIEKNTGRLLGYRSVEESGIISDNHLFFKGQIIYSKIRPNLNKVIIAPFDGLCSADMYPIETSNNVRYFQYLMLSNPFVSQVSVVIQDRVKMPKINQVELGEIFIVVPPISEQQEIADYLDKKTTKIDSLVEELEAQLTDLATYKQAVITEAVTGKVDVRDWTPKS